MLRLAWERALLNDSVAGSVATMLPRATLPACNPPGQGVRISLAEPGDAVVLTEIAFAAKRYWGYPESWIQEWTSLLTITPEFIREHPTFVMRKDREILGVAALEVQGAEASVLHLWVKPTAMGRGIGAALFAECEAAARRSGATRLTVESDPHAEGFYRRMGAVIIGQVPANLLGVERSLPKLEKILT